ncbi:VanW family protein [Sporosarcina beigongshangi]|uniref:VanW family protein n=1 Tax=Sporosarcina beigongshangi TaxID=2782538 RepID=UPI001939660D|nr:VanW family protein [Sporosarcina beigongshangi]
MKIRRKSIVLFSLIACLLYFGLFANGALNQTALAKENNVESSIGGVVVEGLKKDEMLSKISLSISNWQEHEVVVEGSGMTLSIPAEYFSFDVQASVEKYFDSAAKSWYAFWKKTPSVHIPLVLTMDSRVKEKIAEFSIFQTDETYERIAEQVSYLTSSPIDAVVHDLSLYESERISFSIVEMAGDSADLLNVVNELNDRLIGNGEVYSFLNETELIEGSVSEATMNFVASVLFSVVLQTDYEVVERHSQNIIPLYLSAGVEAKIQRTLKEDFRFINSSNAPAILKLSVEDNRLLVELYSLPIETKATFRVVKEMDVNPRIIYRYSSELAIGDEKLLQEGVPGVRVSVYRTVSDKLGPYEKESLITRDFYPPVHRIVLKSSKQPETTGMNPDLTIDLDGNTLPDVVGNGDANDGDVNGGSISGEVTDLYDLPEGSFYDKGGNLIEPTNR